MPKLLETSFVAYKFSAEELIAARNLGPEQRMYYQTLLSDAAEEKLAEEFDPEHPLISARREAYLRGQMDILNMLLSNDASQIALPKRYEKDDLPTVVPSKP